MIRTERSLFDRSLAVLAALLLTLLSCGEAGLDSAPGLSLPEEVIAYDARSSSWGPASRAGLEEGTEFRVADTTYRVEQGEARLLGEISAAELGAADQQWSGDAQVPGLGSWVRTVDGAVKHVRLSELEPGARFAWRGRIYESAGTAALGVTAVRGTGEVVQRVVQTQRRTTDTVLDVVLEYPDGRWDQLTATPDHPFWLPDEERWAELGELEAGSVLQTRGGEQAVVSETTWRTGRFEVFNFEVEGRHNYFVAGEGDLDGALAHNCPDPGDVVGASKAAPKLLTDSRAGQKLLGQPITWQAKDLERVISKHGPDLSGKGGAFKSRFFEGENIEALIQQGTNQLRSTQEGSKNLVRTWDVGREIGTDVATGEATTWMTVVTSPSGRLVTAHPGR